MGPEPESERERESGKERRPYISLERERQNLTVTKLGCKIKISSFPFLTPLTKMTYNKIVSNLYLA